MKIIERTEEEYLQDIEKQYETEMKPLLDQGISMTEAFRRMGVGSGKGARKYKELRRIALERGYQLTR